MKKAKKNREGSGMTTEKFMERIGQNYSEEWEIFLEAFASAQGTPEYESATNKAQRLLCIIAHAYYNGMDDEDIIIQHDYNLIPKEGTEE